MSTTWHLGCIKHKKSIWVGQSNVYTPFYLYGGEETKKLQDFLLEHYCESDDECQLVFGSSDHDDWYKGMDDDNDGD